MIKNVIVICMVVLNAVLAVSFLSGRNDAPDVVEATHLIHSDLEFFGSKEVKSHTLTLSDYATKNKDALVLSYDLRGTCLYSGPASAIILISENGKEYSVPLSAYGENCKEGTQTVEIPFKDFSIRESLDNITSLRTQFWLPTEYSLAISRITLENLILENNDGLFVAAINKIAQNSTATPKSSLPISSTLRKMPTPTPKPNGGWAYCATESGKCSFKGTKEIRYGVNGKYSFKVYSDGIDCHNNVFGDPIKGKLKYCYIRSTTSVAIAGVKPSATAKPGKPVRTPTPTPIPTSTFVARPSITAAPTLLATPAITPQVLASSWAIRSVSSMKETKDKICSPDSAAFINSWINKAIELGVNYIAVETPYDNPQCGSAVEYTKAWVDAIHAKGLNVWHRHMPLAFEGIYNTPKNNTKDYLTQIRNYIKTNPTFFKKGDIFTPIPEPQNGGIKGVTYCHQSICMFDGAASFNKWLRDAITASEESFAAVQLGGQMKIGYYGFDGFVAWGDNNPDWEGILETATVNAMGNITIDHYPEIVGDTMANDLKELTEKYPNTPIIIGEWGTITGGDTVTQVQKSMQAAKIPNVTGFNYWHAGMGGNEALIESNFQNKIQFEAVKSFFIK